MYDLPSEEVGEPGLPDDFHRLQANFLSETCQPPNIPTSEIFTPSDLNLYYDPRHTNWYKRPDWYLVLGVSPTWEGDLRLSYVTWQEKVNPFVVVELLIVILLIIYLVIKLLLSNFIKSLYLNLKFVSPKLKKVI